MAIVSPDNERTLLENTAAGDPSAFTQLYHHYAPEIFHVAMVFLRDEPEANEIVQDVFMKVWQKRESITAIDHFKNYLFILARNRIYDGFKKKASEQKALVHFYRNASGSAVDDTDHRVQDRQYQELLQSAIDSLSPARKNVYLARRQGKSYEAIAGELDISVATAKKQMTQAKQLIQQFILQYLHIYVFLMANGHSIAALAKGHP